MGISGSKKKKKKPLHTGLYTSHNATATTQTEDTGSHPDFDSQKISGWVESNKPSFQSKRDVISLKTLQLDIIKLSQIECFQSAWDIYLITLRHSNMQ